MDEFLKPGDPCPCCGMPIETDDPDKLLALNWLAWAMGTQKKDRPEARAELKKREATHREDNEKLWP